jgi:hypothetical protein
MTKISMKRSLRYLGHDKLKFTALLLILLLLAQDYRLVLQLEVVVVHPCQRITLLRCLGNNVLLDTARHTPLHLQQLHVYRLLALRFGRNTKL